MYRAVPAQVDLPALEHDVLALWLALRDASAARLAEVERAARDYLGEDVDAIGREELVKQGLLRAEQGTMLDNSVQRVSVIRHAVTR